MLPISLYLRRSQRLLSDLPTSKTSGVFIGLVELKGTAQSADPLIAYLSESSCVHYSYTVEERWSRIVVETYTDKDGKTQTRTRHESGWTTVLNGGEQQNFFLRDDTGVVLVRPKGATLETLRLVDETVSQGHPWYYGKGLGGSVSDSDGVRRFTEHGIPIDTPLFIVGQARERADVVAPEIAADRDAPMFLISTRSEERVQSSHSVGSWFCWLIGLIAAGVAGSQIQFPDLGFDRDLWYGALPLLYLAFWAFGWTWMVFNSVVGLRQRVRQGWSLIDIQLKRRHDLIPQLTSVVSALGTHEKEVQAAVAALRTQAQATAPGVSGPDFAGVSATLRVVVEAYPQLVTQEAFAKLHRELVDTEQRIALARTYYNDIATHFATRLERVPDRWVAGLVRMRPEPLLAAEDFERAAVKIAKIDS